MDAMLRPKEVAELLSVSEATLAWWRTLGIGPKYTKFKDAQQDIVRYELKQVREFIEKRQKQNTIEIENEAARIARVNAEQAKAVDGIFIEQRKTIENLKETLAICVEESNKKEAECERHLETIDQLETTIFEQSEESKANKTEAAQRATKDSVSIKNKNSYLSKELELKRGECVKQRSLIKQLREENAKLAKCLEAERLKKTPEPSGQPRLAQRVDTESVRKQMLDEIRKWLVTGETIHHLLIRLKEMELPGGER